jgi:hypothetical protein
MTYREHVHVHCKERGRSQEKSLVECVMRVCCCFFYFVANDVFPICDGAISSDKLGATDHRSSGRVGEASSSPGDLPDGLPIMLSPFCALSGKSLLVCLKDEIFRSP